MRKKRLFYSLIASMLIASSLTSCKDLNVNSSTVNNSTTIPQITSSTTVPQSEISSNPTTSSITTSSSTTELQNTVRLEDNENTQKVYREFIKVIPNVNYNDFLTNASIEEEGNIKVSYNSLYAYLNMDETLKTADIYTRNDNDGLLSWDVYKLINNEIVRTSGYIFINHKLITTYVLNYSNDTFINKYEYTCDDKGNKLTKTYSKYSENRWVYDERYEWTYDVNGNQLTETTLKFKNNAWAYVEKEENTYDDNNEKTTCTKSKYINNKWLVVATIEYINGKRCYTYNLELNNDNTFKIKYEYTYDKNGNRLSEIISDYKNDAWVFREKDENTYDENNNQVIKIYSRFENNAWAYYYKYEYTYDGNGNRLTQITSEYKNNTWVLKEKVDNTYDEYGNDLTEIESYYINNSWVKTMEWLYIDRLGCVTYKMIFNQDRSFSHIDEYTYDDEGNELTYKKTSYLNGEWIKTYESIYINNVQKVLYSIKTKADGSLLYRIVYQYDDEGNELSEEVSRYVNNAWEYHYKYEYTYDSNGVKSTETYSVFTNGEWVVQTK